MRDWRGRGGARSTRRPHTLLPIAVSALLVGGMALAGCGTAPVPGSNVSGPGWNLVQEGPSVSGAAAPASNTVAFAGLASAVPALWPFAGSPKVNLGTDALVRFTVPAHGGPKGCEVARLRRVTISVAGQLIVPFLKDVGVTGCDATVKPYSFVIAVSRHALPLAPFTIQVDADPPSTPGAVLVVQPDEVGVAAPSTDPG